MRPPRRPAKPSRKPRAATTPPPRIADVTIEQVGARGDGIAVLGDEQVFVPYTAAGDRALIRVEGRRGDGLAATLVEIIVPGPGRAQPSCAHYGRCGGCSLQHLEPDLYVAWKHALLTTPLARQGIDTSLVAPLVRIPPGSRRRAAFAFAKRKGVVTLGFNARASHQVVDVEHCPLLVPPLNAALAWLRPLVALVVADGEEGDITVAQTDTGLDVLVEAEARLDLFDREKLAAFAEQVDLARLSWRRPGSAFPEPIARRRAPLVHPGNVPVEPPPGGFLQPTKGGEMAIAEAALAAIGAASPVADLFSGCGSFTFPLAAAGRVVHAVEGEDAPIAALDAAARSARLAVTSDVRDLVRRPLMAAELKKYHAVLFDPPRAGALAQAQEIAKTALPVVVAVSCNPATLARDLRALVDGGYRIESIIPIDQFPWSPHLEAVAVLRR